MPGGGWPGSCSQAVKDRANNLSGVGLYNARNSSCIIYQTKVYRTWRSWYPRKTKAGNAHCTFIYLYHHISVRSCLPPSAHAKKRNRQPCDQRRKTQSKPKHNRESVMKLLGNTSKKTKLGHFSKERARPGMIGSSRTPIIPSFGVVAIPHYDSCNTPTSEILRCFLWRLSVKVLDAFRFCEGLDWSSSPCVLIVWLLFCRRTGVMGVVTVSKLPDLIPRRVP